VKKILFCVCIKKRTELLVEQQKLTLGYRLFFSFGFQQLRGRKDKWPLEENFWLFFCPFSQAIFPGHLSPSGFS